MSKGCRFVILGEDERHLRFAEKFLIERRLAHRREIFLQPVPAGRGAGEQSVRQRFPTELKAIRSQAHFQRKFLLVLIDGDGRPVDQRRRQFEDACKAAGVAPLQPKDMVCVLIPQRNLETWVKFILGEVVDEETDFKHHVTEADRRRASISLAERCRHNEIGPEAPPSLRAACSDFNRLPI